MWRVAYGKIQLVSIVGDLASVLSVLIALGGFAITVQKVRESKSAAIRAETAAKETLERVRYVDTVQKLSRAITIVEEIQRLNRTGEWKVILDRHLVFRSILTEIRSSTPNLDDDRKAIIQDGITHSSTMSNKIEIALDESKQTPKVSRMNNILSNQVVKLRIILAEMRTETDR
ncbi:MAG: hypothetical protein OXC10_07610 [Rhodospirillaceae bacterium]|nr:hypothetical protein [Rhodospirillaceae bacterium]